MDYKLAWMYIVEKIKEWYTKDNGKCGCGHCPDEHSNFEDRTG